MTYVPFSRAAQIADDFLDLLTRLKIEPLNLGRIEGEFLSIIELLDAWKSGRIPSTGGENIIRTAAGIHDFAAKILAAQMLPEFVNFRDHLELIAKGTLQTSLSQMNVGSAIDDAARKLVELYVASLAIHCGTNVLLDHPSRSKGNNPDVMFDYGPYRWGIAIKATSTMNGQTLYDNIKKASKQIDASPADRGLILLNVKNTIDHDALWQQNFRDLSDAMSALRLQMEAHCEAAALNRPDSEWDALFAGKAELPVLLMAQSVVRLPTLASQETATPLKMFFACDFNRKSSNDAWELVSCLTHWMQKIV